MIGLAFSVHSLSRLQRAFPRRGAGFPCAIELKRSRQITMAQESNASGSGAVIYMRVWYGLHWGVA